MKEDPLVAKKKSKITRKKGKSRKSKSSRTTKSKRSKKSKEKVKIKKSLVEDGNYNVIEVKNPLRYVHIDYELFPKKFKYGVDVVCWGPVAKIFTKSGTKCVKTVIKEDIAWVPVFIEHYLTPLPNEEIRKMLKQVINVQIKTGKNNVGAKAKAEKTTKFYIFDEDSANEFFPEIFTEKPKGEDNEIMKKEIARILKKLQTFPIGREIVTWIYNMDDVHTHNIAKLLAKRSRGEDVCCKDFYEEEVKPTKKKDKGKKPKGSKTSKSGTKSTKRHKGSKKSKKSTKSSKKSRSNETNYKIPAHVFLSDPALATYQVKDAGGKLAEIYVLLSSENILTAHQKIEMCPLVVKICKINNLPCDVLRENGFSKVFSICTIPGIDEFKTSPRPITDAIRFDESRFIIGNDHPDMKILEILETRRVMVKIIGIKDTTAEKLSEAAPAKKKKKGKEKKKSRKSDKSSKKSKKSKKSSKTDDAEREVLTLAVATFDLSSLGETFYLFREKGQCYNIRSVVMEKPPPLESYFLDRLTINEVNLTILGTNRNESPLMNDKMFFDCTTLKLEAHFLKHAHPLFYIKDTSNYYKRLLLILFKEDVAKVILSSIMLFNQQFLRVGPLFIPYYMILKKPNPLYDPVSEEVENMLSGFCIDDGNCFIMYIEGLANGYILTLLHEVSSFNYSTGKVFFNTDYLFEERLYVGFHKYTGFVVLNLKLPLAEIFAQEKFYIEGNVPVHCFKAVQKLYLVLNSSTLKEILNHDLLPTEIELLSLATEYAFSLRYKEKCLTEIPVEEGANG